MVARSLGEQPHALVPHATVGEPGAPQKRHGKAVAARNFSAHVDNPWYPLKRGTVWRYRGSEGKDRTSNVVRVTHRTKRIKGVPCVVVRDRVYTNGHLSESTLDYFTQDGRGTVWYFGEATRELDRHGRTTSREGSWQTGRHGAKPGIIMPAHPRVGFSARQEYRKGHAEDHFKILSKHKSVKVPYGRFHRRAMLTREWTPLEPGVIDHKYYVQGIGTVKEQQVAGSKPAQAEVTQLVSFTPGA